jgi:hypothetical protein
LELTGLTLADLFTPAGIAAASTIVFLIVQIAKANFPALDARVSGATQASVVIAVLYVGAFFATPGTSIFTAILYFLLATSSAIGISSGLNHISEVREDHRDTA